MSATKERVLVVDDEPDMAESCAFFLNRGHFDLFYHWLALVAALNLCARTELAKAPEILAVDTKPDERRATGEVTVSMPGMRAPRPAVAGAGAEVIAWQKRTRWR